MTSPSMRLRDRVIVITGASSGIGRAAAERFASEGARLVLAARREEALRRVAAQCEARGARTLVVPTDVTDPSAVSRLARAAAEAFEDIDVWINNAGVGLFGSFVSADIATHRRVIETNLFGAMNGAAAVLPYFLRQRRGTLISNVSIGAFSPVPYAAAYTASKFGLRGFMASLRQEVARFSDIHICSVFPSVVDTPGFQHGGNVSGVALRPAGPMLSAEEVAAGFLSLIEHPRAELTLGWPTLAAKTGYGLAPRLTERIAGRIMRRFVKTAPPAPRTAGNLFEPVLTGLGTSGGWALPERRLHPGKLALAAGMGIGAGLLAARVVRRLRAA